MFYYISGIVKLLEENLAVIDCGGIGFACHTGTATLSRLRTGETCTLYTHCNIQEDAFDIYGFYTKRELDCFRLLIGVTGVGPKAALALLSALTPESLTLAILAEDEKTLTSARGVGKKMAQRIILELKDKLAGQTTELDFSSDSAPSTSANAVSGGKAEVFAALAALGYSQADAAAALRGVDLESMSVQDGIRYALRAMMKG